MGKALKENPAEALDIFLKFINFKEMKIYKLLLKKSLTINQIKEHIKVSERTIRKHIKNLYEKCFIKRRVEKGKRLRYRYKAISLIDTWKIIEEKIRKMIYEISSYCD